MKVYEELINNLNEISLIDDNLFLEQKFSNDELPLFVHAFSDELFTPPQKEEVFTESYEGTTIFNGGCIFYFKKLYYLKLVREVLKIWREGKFEQSKDGNEWINLLNLLLSAKIRNIDDFTELGDYYDDLEMFFDV
jgi:hypothetical protein